MNYLGFKLLKKKKKKDKTKYHRETQEQSPPIVKYLPFRTHIPQRKLSQVAFPRVPCEQLCLKAPGGAEEQPKRLVPSRLTGVSVTEMLPSGSVCLGPELGSHTAARSTSFRAAGQASPGRRGPLS